MRPGFKTSEFVSTLLAVAGSLLAVNQNYVSTTTGTGLSVAAAVAFILSRGLAKYEPRADPGGSGTP